MPALEDNFAQIVGDHTAGDPMRDDVVWTYLSSTEIAQRLDKLGTPIGPDTVRTLLNAFDFHKRQAEKTKTMGDTPFRNEQFENIARLKQRYLASPNPIISMDTKKKELLGEFFRRGQRYSNGANATFDHDFPSYADGKLIPHGLYDFKRNLGHITLGTSHDTSQFACDSFRLWWRRHGRRSVPEGQVDPALVRRGRQQQLSPSHLQGRPATAGQPDRVPDPCGPLSSALLEVQPDRTPSVSSCHSCLVRRDISHARNRHHVPSPCLDTHRSESHLRRARQVTNETKCSDDFLDAFPIRFDMLPDWNYTVVPTDY